MREDPSSDHSNMMRATAVYSDVTASADDHFVAQCFTIQTSTCFDVLGHYVPLITYTDIIPVLLPLSQVYSHPFRRYFAALVYEGVRRSKSSDPIDWLMYIINGIMPLHQTVQLPSTDNWSVKNQVEMYMNMVRSVKSTSNVRFLDFHGGMTGQTHWVVSFICQIHVAYPLALYFAGEAFGRAKTTPLTFDTTIFQRVAKDRSFTTFLGWPLTTTRLQGQLQQLYHLPSPDGQKFLPVHWHVFENNGLLWNSHLIQQQTAWQPHMYAWQTFVVAYLWNITEGAVADWFTASEVYNLAVNFQHHVSDQITLNEMKQNNEHVNDNWPPIIINIGALLSKFKWYVPHDTVSLRSAL